MISLYDRAGVLVEQVVYRDMLGEERGRSLERASEKLCSTDPGGIWHRCARPDGCTPGAANSVRSPGLRQNLGPIHQNTVAARTTAPQGMPMAGLTPAS